MWYWIIGWFYMLAYMIANRYDFKKVIDDEAFKVKKDFSEATADALITLGIIFGIGLGVVIWPIHIIYLVFINITK